MTLLREKRYRARVTLIESLSNGLVNFCYNILAPRIKYVHTPKMDQFVSAGGRSLLGFLNLQ
jgi:hypothetical protein